MLRSINKSNGYSIKVFLEFILNICNQAVELDQLRDLAQKIKYSVEKIASLISLYRVFTGNFQSLNFN